MSAGGRGGIDPSRVAIDLYPIVLRDPQPADWLTDPMESLAALIVPHGLTFEHWFEAAVARKDHELAIEVADRARRHRFLCTLPLGGRLESLRWVLEGAKELLPPQALLQRQELLGRYPVYKDLLDQANALRQELVAVPLVQNDADKTKKQGQALAELMKIGRKQEIVMREMAVRRDPAAIAFPPLRTTAEIQKSLPPGHAMLIFFATSRNLYAFRLNREKYATWQVALTPQDLARQLTTLLREIGNISQNYELTSKDLADGKWRQTARELLEGLLKAEEPADRLEVRRTGHRARRLPLVRAFRGLAGEGRRATASADLLLPHPLFADGGPGHGHAGLEPPPRQYGDRRGQARPQVGRGPGRGHGQGPVEIAARLRDAEDALAGRGPDLRQFHRPPGGARRLESGRRDRSLRLVAAAHRPHQARRAAGRLVPLAAARAGRNGAAGLSLGLRSFIEEDRSRAARGARGADALGPGNEIFLSLCGMMSTGTRTVLLSRWRSGGQTSLDLVREFTQELPHTTPADAWQRAVQVVSNSTLNIEAEPRLRKAGGESAEGDAESGPRIRFSGPVTCWSIPAVPPRNRRPSRRSRGRSFRRSRSFLARKD